MSAPTVAVIGAGIGGLTAAIALRAKGIDVEIYEAAPEPRATGTALGIASNATKVLRALGIDLPTDASCRALEHFELRTARGALIRALPGAAITAELGHPFVSIHRNELIRTLRNAAADIPIHYGAEVVDVGIERCGARAACADGTDVRAGVLIGADGIRSAVRSMVAGEQAPSEYGYVCWLATVRFSHPRMVPGYTGHYWGRGQRFGLIDIGGGMAYWWGTKNMPAAQARDWNGDKADILAAFDGWAPEVVEAIERTPADAIISVPAQDRPFLKQWGRGPDQPAGRRRAPDADQQVTRRELRGGGRLRVGGGDRPHTRCGRGPARIRGQAPTPRRDAGAELAAAQQIGAGTESGRLCGAEPRAALCADAIVHPADDPSHAISTWGGQHDRGPRCGAASARSSGGSGSPTRFHLSMLLPACALKVTFQREYWSGRRLFSPLNIRCCGWLSAPTPMGRNRSLRRRHRAFRSAGCRAASANGSVKSTSTNWERRWIGAAVRWFASSTSCLDAPQEAHDVVLTVSHIIADGTTAFSLLRRLVERGSDQWERCRVAAHHRCPRWTTACTLSWPAGYHKARCDRIGRWACHNAGPALQAQTRINSGSGAAEAQARPAHAHLDTAGHSDATVSRGRRHRTRRARRRDGDGDRTCRGTKNFGTNVYRFADRLPRGTGSPCFGRRGWQLREHGAVDSAFRW